MKSSEKDETFAIGVLAERFGLATHVLRHWESMGLLHPGRDRSGRRCYTREHLIRVAVILRAKEAGLGLETIRELSATSDPTARRTTLLRERDALQQRIAAAQASLELIQCALDCDQDDFTQCPHFQQMVTDRTGLEASAHIPV